MRHGLWVGVLILAGCASRPRSPSPYIPPAAMYSGPSVLAAAGGVMGLASGAQMMDSDRSPRTRQVGRAAAAAGMGLMAAALVEALEVEERREMLLRLDVAWRRQMMGGPTVDQPFQEVPPLPELPFQFEEDSSWAEARPMP